MLSDGGGPDGQVEVRPWEDAYLRGGRFDKDAMLALIQEALESGKRDGYGLTRLWANMEWALQALPGVENLIEYETRLNYGPGGGKAPRRQRSASRWRTRTAWPRSPSRRRSSSTNTTERCRPPVHPSATVR